jgi:hypothetical protein
VWPYTYLRLLLLFLRRGNELALAEKIETYLSTHLKRRTGLSALAPKIDMKTNITLTLSLLASLTLAACGGGGGGGGDASATPSSSSASSPSAANAPASASNPTAASSPTAASTPDAASAPVSESISTPASSPAATSNPTAASAPAAASAPTAASTPAVNGEPLPMLASPQAGSTAAVGNGVEGIWTTLSGISSTTAFIDPQGNLSALNSIGSFGMSELFGVVAATSPNWTLTSGWTMITGFSYTTTTGSGSFARNAAFSGSYVENGNTVNLSWTYDAANALAVTQSSVAGTWAEATSSLTIANDGTLTGTLSGCPVNGTLLLATPGSNKNLYTLSVTGTTTTCGLNSSLTYSGNAAIKFLPISGSNLYSRSILYLIKSSTNVTVAYGQLSPQ